MSLVARYHSVPHHSHPLSTVLPGEVYISMADVHDERDNVPIAFEVARSAVAAHRGLKSPVASDVAMVDECASGKTSEDDSEAQVHPLPCKPGYRGR